MTGSASVIRNDQTTPLKVKDDIYLNDVVQTGANSALGITFIDATTFNLKASTKITIDNYVYEDGGKSNAAIFDVAKGTAAFVAASVAKTGDMKITTPTATLGIRGTTGLVEVPEGAAANNPNNVAVKLYPDADGRVGRIEVNDRAGARLGFLTQGASGFTIRPGAGGARFAAVPLVISASRDVARPGLCASASLDAECRPAARVPAARIPPRQSRLRQSEPSDPAIAARPAAAEWFAGTEPARTTTAWSVESSRPAAAERPARATRSAATADCAEPPGTAAARPAQSSRTTATTGHATARRTAATGLAQSTRRATADRTTVTPRFAGTARTAAACRTTATIRSAAAARPAAARGTTATARRAGDRPTGSACPDCSACPAFRERQPCNGLDCPPRRGGPRPRRNAASRRQRISASRKMASGIAPQPVAQLLHEASRLRSSSALHRVDGHRLYLQRK